MSAPADRSLLAALSDEERAFFQQPLPAGPVSYGRRGAQPVRPEVPLGQHLDLRA